MHGIVDWNFCGVVFNTTHTHTHTHTYITHAIYTHQSRNVWLCKTLSFYQPWTLKPITNINIYLQLLIKGQCKSRIWILPKYIYEQFFLSKSNKAHRIFLSHMCSCKSEFGRLIKGHKDFSIHNYNVPDYNLTDSWLTNLTDIHIPTKVVKTVSLGKKNLLIALKISRIKNKILNWLQKQVIQNSKITDTFLKNNPDIYSTGQNCGTTCFSIIA